MSEHRRVELGESVPSEQKSNARELTVSKLAFSRNPFFEPAKMHRRESMKATRERRSGIAAVGRIISETSAQQKKRRKEWQQRQSGECAGTTEFGKYGSRREQNPSI